MQVIIIQRLKLLRKNEPRLNHYFLGSHINIYLHMYILNAGKILLSSFKVQEPNFLHQNVLFCQLDFKK